MNKYDVIAALAFVVMVAAWVFVPSGIVSAIVTLISLIIVALCAYMVNGNEIIP